MTALDDLLDSSSLVMYPASIVAFFPELEPGYTAVAGATAAESLIQIGQQIGPQGVTVNHSFDDGLPDPVTLTGSNDASGTFEMDLVGRPGVVAADSSLGTVAASTSGQGTGTTFTTTYPAGMAYWDYAIVAVTVSNDSIVTETSMPADSLYAWKLLGDATDSQSGSFQRTWVFGRKHYITGVTAPSFQIATSGNYAWTINGIKCGRTPSGDVYVPVTPGDVKQFAEGASAVTAHTLPSVDIEGRGWTVGVVAAPAAAGAWSAPGATVIGSLLGSSLSIATVISPLRSYRSGYTLTANTANAAQLVTGVHIAMEIRERPTLDAVGYFSPLNTKSPIYGFERDVAPLEMYINNIATDGNQTESTKIFTGQMTGVDIQGRTATTAGVSKTRLLLDSSREIPTVHPFREGLEIDWLIGYLLAHGGQYIGIAPSIYTRWWGPLHGSLKPYMGGSTDYAESRDWVLGRSGDARITPPVVTGPFVTGMFAEQKNEHTSYIYTQVGRIWATEVPGIPGAKNYDLLSQENSMGRLSFWIRGDPADQTPTCVDSGVPGDYYLFDSWVNNSYLGNDFLNIVRFRIRADRSYELRMGTQTIPMIGADLPTDGNWYFICVVYNYATGEARVRRNGAQWSFNGDFTSAAAETLPESEAAMNANGGFTSFFWNSHLPIADVQLEAGPTLYSEGFARFYPTPQLPSRNATYRPIRQPLAVIANPTPVQGWATLQSLAESTLSWMRVNEADNVEFVPLDYFGETAQMTVETLNVLDTDFNAAEIGLNLDPSRTRNVVTIAFPETRVSSTIAPILEMNTSLAIPRGITNITFALDTLTAETHGAAQFWTETPTFNKLNASQIAGTSPLPNENIMSVNTKSDGTGTVFTSTAFTARIQDWTSNSITVQFNNTYSSTLYLANNGAQIPFLRAMGYVINSSDGYSTVRDDGSITRRRERALTTDMEWVHDRTTAQQVASKLVTLLARPRPVISVTVQGDPRRVPGKLCQVVDATGTQAAGTWRITSVSHRYNGPMYVQDVTLIYVGAIGNWDEGVWDDAVWGA